MSSNKMKITKIEEKQKQIIKEPNNENNYLQIGKIYHENVKYQEAIHAYDKGLEIKHLSDELHCAKGLTLHNTGDHIKAIREYKKATKINSGNYEAQYYLGFIMIQEGEQEEAIKYLIRAIKINTQLDIAYYYLCILLARRGDQEKAEAIIKTRIVESYPKIGFELCCTLGEIVSKRRVYEKVESHDKYIEIKLLEIMDKEEIHCFGDSHRSIFNNMDKVECHNVGSGTAYNLISQNTTSGAGSKIINIVKRLDPSKSGILLVFGEIDCMEHIIKNVYKTDAKCESIIESLKMRYMNFAKELRNRGFTVLIYGPSMSGLAMNSYGDGKERQMIMRKLNKIIDEECKREDLIYFASLEKTLAQENNRADLRISEDGRHLDHFPKGSTVFQSIILSKFIETISNEKDKRSELQSLKEEEMALELNYPYMIIEPDRIEASQDRIGTIFKDENYEILLRDNRAAYIIIDLMDHIKVRTMTIQMTSSNGLTAEEYFIKIITTQVTEEKETKWTKIKSEKINYEFNLERVSRIIKIKIEKRNNKKEKERDKSILKFGIKSIIAQKIKSA